MKMTAAVSMSLLMPALAGVAAAPASAQASAAAQRPAISGTVTGQNGKPVAGATCYVYTAAVRTGTSPYCPTCYPECGKRAKTDAQGRFSILSVSPALTYRLLIVRDGYAPTFVHADPLKEAVTAKLTARPAPQGATDRDYLAGTIVDPTGQPVAGATVEVTGETTGSGGSYGTIPGVDPLGVSDESGRFRLHVSRPQSKYQLLVTARGLAPQMVPAAAPGTPFTLALRQEAALRGVVADANGKPMPGVVVHLNQKDRNAETFLGQQQIGTNDKGEFLFTNLAPEQEYVVCPAMESLRGSGIAAPVATVRLPADGKTLEGLRLSAAPARIVAGRVRLTDGKPIPAGTRVMLGRDGTWDVQFAEAGADGRFAFRGVPANAQDSLGLTVGIRGYRLSKKTPGLEKAGEWVFSLPVKAGTENVSGVELLYEPAKR